MLNVSSSIAVNQLINEPNEYDFEAMHVESSDMDNEDLDVNVDDNDMNNLDHDDDFNEQLISNDDFANDADTYQIAILLLFNEKTEYLVKDIVELTQIKMDLLVQVLALMFKSKLLVKYQQISPDLNMARKSIQRCQYNCKMKYQQLFLIFS
jgi:hypothetical protein